jgi:hypothetical protein
MVFLTKHLVCAGEVGYITDDEEVMASNRTLDDSFTFTGRESCILNGNTVILTVESRILADKFLLLVFGSSGA